MPRAKKHGGMRESAPGTAHSNRTDMNSALPVQTAPAEGRAFGAASADEAAQQEVPMGPPPSATGGMPDASGPMPMPGELGGMADPMPDVPVTSGIRSGPGGGPETLRTFPRNRGLRMLEIAAADSNDPYLRSLLNKKG